jgi:hypothetical protein
MRAALAKVHPALLAASPGKNLQYGLGLDPDRDPIETESIRTSLVIEQLSQFVENFSKGDSGVCTQALRRRNAELHTALAAMENLDLGWRGRLFATCQKLAKHLELDLTDLLGSDNAALVESLIVEDAASVRDAAKKARDAAARRVQKLSGAERKTREEAVEEELHPRVDALAAYMARRKNPRILKEVPCPACNTTIALRGEVASSSRPRVDADGDLVRIDVALPSVLRCGVCELEVEGLPQLTALGFGDPVYLTDSLDPIETFGVELSDYQDEFMASYHGPEYEDE